MWLMAAVTGALLLLRKRGGVLPALLTAAAAASTAQTIVISALPALGSELGVSGAAATWTLTAFMLASAVATPVAGRLGDMFGYRRTPPPVRR